MNGPSGFPEDGDAVRANVWPDQLKWSLPLVRKDKRLFYIPEEGKEKKMKKRIFDIYLALPNPSGEKDTDEYMIETKR